METINNDSRPLTLADIFLEVLEQKSNDESQKAYIRKVQYYETDMMGFTHHANYIHWMEEARIDFMDQIGFPYRRMEAEGVSFILNTEADPEQLRERELQRVQQQVRVRQQEQLLQLLF